MQETREAERFDKLEIRMAFEREKLMKEQSAGSNSTRPGHPTCQFMQEKQRHLRKRRNERLVTGAQKFSRTVFDASRLQRAQNSSSLVFHQRLQHTRPDVVSENAAQTPNGPNRWIWEEKGAFC